MKTIGILGGMSAASTQIYYRELSNRTRERLGGLHSPELLIRSLDFANIEALQMAGEWDQAGAILNREAKALERGGADFIILATNTMHKLADQMMRGVSIPMMHIGPVGSKLRFWPTSRTNKERLRCRVIRSGCKGVRRRMVTEHQQ